MHLSKEEIAQLFHERFGTPADATPQQLTQKARELLRQNISMPILVSRVETF